MMTKTANETVDGFMKRMKDLETNAATEITNLVHECMEKGFNEDQAQVITMGYLDGVDISIYSDPRYNADQMFRILDGLEHGIDVSYFTNPEFTKDEMYQISYGLKKGLDVSVYADPKYNVDQMQILEIALESGVDVSGFSSPYLEASEMRNRLIEKLAEKRADATHKTHVKRCIIFGIGFVIGFFIVQLLTR